MAAARPRDLKEHPQSLETIEVSVLSLTELKPNVLVLIQLQLDINRSTTTCGRPDAGHNIDSNVYQDYQRPLAVDDPFSGMMLNAIATKHTPGVF